MKILLTFCAMLLGFACSDAITFAVESKGKPDVSLTLIPPSPVTDKITLDIRGAVWNHKNEAKTYQVGVYLDKENPKMILHKETLQIPASSCKGIKFTWETKGHSGKHKVILVAKSTPEIYRRTQPLEIIASDIRSTRRIDGGWFEFYHWSEAEGLLWNKEIAKLTDKQWQELIAGMHGIGMDLVIIQDLYHNPDRYVGKHNMEKEGFPGYSHYPSSMYPKNPIIAAKDPLKAVLAEADKHGMYVMVAVGNYAWFDFTPGSLQWHKKVADELWQMYGSHPSFYGWYVSEEVAGDLGTDDLRRQQIVEFFREFKQHVTKLAPDKPVMLATNCHMVAKSDGYYPRLLENLDILCPFAFHRMPPNDYSGEEVAAILQKYCDEAGSHLWLDMEVFLFGPHNELYPRPIDGVIDDLARFPNFEKICCYSYTGLMNSPSQSCTPGGPATVELYNDYKKFLTEGPPDYTVNHDALGKAVKLTVQAGPKYAKGDLTNGKIAGRDYLSEQWLGFQNSDFHATVDLGRIWPIKQLQVNFLQDIRWGRGIVLPSQVEFYVSDNGKDYHIAATVNHEISKGQSGSFTHTFEKDNLDCKARYVRLCAKAAGEWLFADEIIVNPFPKIRK
jgi:hypothetical protein